jgi:hypothetical protein
MHAPRVFLFVILGTGILMAQDNKVITLSGFTVEINNKQQEYEQSISSMIDDLAPLTLLVYEGEGFRYLVEFRFKGDGKRIKVRRTSQVLLSDGTRVKGNTKKEVQFMSSSAPGIFEFPVAENIVLDKKNYSTFFVSYRAQVKYQSPNYMNIKNYQ